MYVRLGCIWALPIAKYKALWFSENIKLNVINIIAKTESNIVEKLRNSFRTKFFDDEIRKYNDVNTNRFETIIAVIVLSSEG